MPGNRPFFYAIGAFGSDNVFVGFLNDELSTKRAAAIANAAPGDAVIQDMMLERNVPTNELGTFAGYVRKMRNSGNLNLGGVQLSLFAGKDDMAMLAAMQRERRPSKRRNWRRRRAAWKACSRREKLCPRPSFGSTGRGPATGRG